MNNGRTCIINGQAWWRRIGRGVVLVSGLLCGCVPALYGSDGGVVADSRVPLLDLMRQGGWTMFPLATCSLAALALSAYVFWESASGRILSGPLGARGLDLWGDDGNVGWRQWLERDTSLVARTLLRVEPPTVNAGRWREEVGRVLKLEEMRLTQWVTYLNVVAALAPMIGLLGTVSGMIGAFQTISAGGMGRPELLAGDIGQALVTTATGLSIGIPAMVAFFYLRNRVELCFEEAYEWLNAIARCGSQQ